MRKDVIKTAFILRYREICFIEAIDLQLNKLTKLTEKEYLMYWFLHQTI